jgi:hypothetical protein
MLSILVACTSEPQSYISESETWKAELNTSDGEKIENFVLSYTGDDIQSIGIVNVKVDGKSFGIQMRDAELNEDGKLSFDEGPNMRLDNKNEIICIVDWDGQTEEIILNNQ